MVGVLLSFLLLPNLSEETLNGWVGKGLLDSANILLITGAGGSLGAVLSNSPISDYIKTLATGNVAGIGAIVLLFVISALLKTAQGSSTVALVYYFQHDGSHAAAVGYYYTVAAGISSLWQ